MNGGGGMGSDSPETSHATKTGLKAINKPERIKGYILLIMAFVLPSSLFFCRTVRSFAIIPLDPGTAGLFLKNFGLPRTGESPGNCIEKRFLYFYERIVFLMTWPKISYNSH
jgi:hypothetical protein